MKFKFVILILLALCLIIPLASAANCGDGFCKPEHNETVVTCCEDCGCEGNQTCYGDFWYTKTCVDPFCGDEYCDIDLDENSIPDEYWKNCCDDCGCHGADSWEAEKLIGFDLPYYTPTDDFCYENKCHGCNIDRNCDDHNNCTVDQCLRTAYLNNKSVCFNAPITRCKNGDGCCPGGCSYYNDTDCAGECGDRICEFPENCDTCEYDCGCDISYECVDGKCVRGERYCEMKGEVKEGLFCNGRDWVTLFEEGKYCNNNYQCALGVCDGSVCVVEGITKEERAQYIKIGLLVVALAFVVVYLIIIVSKHTQKEPKEPYQ